MNENGQSFLQELQELCAKYNTTIFAGHFGLIFVFQNETDKENARDYFTQNIETKEFIISK